MCQVDGDVFRQSNKKEKDFSKRSILENNLKIISYCNQIQKNYDFILVAVISPYQQTRDKARETFNKNYIEVFLDCPLEVLEKNDVKGLYKKAKSGEINNLIGFSENSPYERPQNPEITIKTDKKGIAESLEAILNFLEKWKK